MVPGLFNGVEVVSGEACLYTESFIYAQVDRRLQGTARSMVSMHGKAPVGGWCILCRGVKGGGGGLQASPSDAATLGTCRGAHPCPPSLVGMLCCALQVIAGLDYYIGVRNLTTIANDTLTNNVGAGRPVIYLAVLACGHGAWACTWLREGRQAVGSQGGGA